jgi:hypothetical protein
VKEIDSIPYDMEPSLFWRKEGLTLFRLDIPPYMNIYSVLNVENLKLFESPMIMDQDEEVSIPLLDEFSLEYLDELQEDIILDRRMRTSCSGDFDYL